MASPRFDWERHVRDRPDVTGPRLLTLLTLATFTNGKGIAYPGIDTIATATGLGYSSVRKHLRWAVDAGLLDQVVRGHRLGNGTTIASRYRLIPQPLTGERLTETSTAHDSDLNRSLETPQPLTSEHLTEQEQIRSSAVAAVDLDAFLADLGREAS